MGFRIYENTGKNLALTVKGSGWRGLSKGPRFMT